MDGGGTIGDRTALVTPPRTEPVDSACLIEITDGRPGEHAVLVVSYARPAEAVVRHARKHLGARPRNLAVVGIDDATRSVTGSASAPAAPGRPVAVVSTADPTDVAALSDQVERFLADWEREPGSAVVYVDSLTAMLHRVGIAGATWFVDSLGGVLEPDGRAGYIRLDDGAHDRCTLGVLDPLFDGVLGLDGGDDPSWQEHPSLHEAVDADGPTLPAEQAFRLLAPPRRRLLLHHLRRSSVPVQLAELAATIARVEADAPNDVADEHCSRVYTDCYHVHLPTLAHHGVVTFDESTGAVALADQRRVEPYLTLTAPGDLHA